MNPDAMQELKSELSDELRDRFSDVAKHADHLATHTVREMVDDGRAIELTEDEERMLKAYRSFRQRNSSGVFSWKIEEEPGLVVPESPSLILDPRDVSA